MSTPTKIAILIFPGFQLLDYAGPLDALNILSTTHTLHLYTIGPSSISPVSTQNHLQTAQGSTSFAQAIVPTHTFATAPTDIDVLLIPGGPGSRGEGSEGYMKEVEEWLAGLDLSGSGSIKYVLTICTGSEILARTGVLDGRKATTNKRAFNDVKSLHPHVHWIARARWVTDGAIWTSSGISAGMDLAFAWIAAVWGEETAQYVADRSEYVRNVDGGDDGRFAERWGAV